MSFSRSEVVMSTDPERMRRIQQLVAKHDIIPVRGGDPASRSREVPPPSAREWHRRIFGAEGYQR